MAFSPKLLQQGASGAGAANYIEDVFSCFLYTGNGSTQTITNGIDLAGKGGLVWSKDRGDTVTHQLFDSVRGTNKTLSSATTNAQGNNSAPYVPTFLSTGFETSLLNNENAHNFVSWTFREAPKFFDVVTWVGTNGVRNLAHNLGSVPGSIFVKKMVGAPQSWAVYHRSLGATKGLALDLTNAQDTWSGYWNNTEPTSTQFTVGDSYNANDLDYPGTAYVAYVFAHDAGGFGLTGLDNVISCGSYTGNGSSTGPEVNIGYEPQWLLIKEATQSGNAWSLFDNMRGLSVAGPSRHLRPNASDAEDTTSVDVRPTATGFQLITSSGRVNRSGETFIYIAIRRGPMKVPTSGTSVFEPTVATVNSASGTIVSSGSVSAVDMTWTKGKANASAPFLPQTRLTGGNYLQMSNTNAESADSYTTWDRMSGTKPIPWSNGDSCIDYAVKRAPSFMDVACYTGNGSTQNVNHNLGVAPEMIILKNRDDAGTDWWVYAAPLTTPQNKYLRLQSTDGESTATGLWGSSLPTSTTFGLGNFSPNQNTKKFVAYLFATCAGVSKVGSYTGDNSNGRIIDCGFTSGARFVLIKRTDPSGGQWAVWDTARGINAGGDPYLMLNNTLAEVAGYDDIDTHSTGFIINDNAPSPGIPVNVAGATYIFLAIA